MELVEIAKRVERGERPKELSFVTADTLIDVLVNKMKASKTFSFEETIQDTARSELGKACFIVLGLVDRRKLLPNTDFSYLTPVIPLVYAMQVAGYARYVDTLATDRAFNYRGTSEGRYSLWDIPENRKSVSYSKLGLGLHLGALYLNRSPARPMQQVITNRRKLKHYGYPTSTLQDIVEPTRQVLEMQLDIARPSERNARMILDINEWDRLPKEMCE